MILWHNCQDPFKIKMTFDTNIFSTPFLMEQRRARRTIPEIEISVNSWHDAQKARNLLGQSPEVVYVPVLPEGFRGVRGSVGSHTVTILDDISYYYFIKTLPDLYLCDEDENLAKIVSLLGNVLTLDQDLAGSGSNMFPCIKGFTNLLEHGYITDRVLSYQATVERILE